MHTFAFLHTHSDDINWSRMPNIYCSQEEEISCQIYAVVNLVPSNSVVWIQDCDYKAVAMCANSIVTRFEFHANVIRSARTARTHARVIGAHTISHQIHVG